MLSKLEHFQKETEKFYLSKTKDEILELLKLSGFDVAEDGSVFDKGIKTNQFDKYLK